MSVPPQPAEEGPAPPERGEDAEAERDDLLRRAAELRREIHDHLSGLSRSR